MLYVLLAVLMVVLAVALWQLFGAGPRRHRAFRRAQRLLHEGAWQQALDLAETLQAVPGLSQTWMGRLRNLAGECHHLAADLALKERRYEESLQHHLTAAPLLGLDEADQRARVIDAMLADARRSFAAGTGPSETESVQQTLYRVFALQPACPEASFWLGLCFVRQGHLEP